MNAERDKQLTRVLERIFCNTSLLNKRIDIYASLVNQFGDLSILGDIANRLENINKTLQKDIEAKRCKND